jgi:NAD(P)H-flavin reductase
MIGNCVPENFQSLETVKIFLRPATRFVSPQAQIRFPAVRIRGAGDLDEIQSCIAPAAGAVHHYRMATSVKNPVRFVSRVVAMRRLSETGFELTVERGGIEFRAGQLVTVHGRDLLDDRSYTICSGERDEHLQILFRFIADGKLTPQLVTLRPGDPVEISGPYGEFTLRDPAKRIYFMATGTGIAPARAFARSHANLKMTIFHGVRDAEDLFYRDELSAFDHHPCVSGGKTEFFSGRVTGLAAKMELPADAHYYLCGANEMFYAMRDVLAARGVTPEKIFTEAYYYRGDE